jgi:hypothetical protein
MDIWRDEDLDQLEKRIDYATRTEDDGRALIIAPQAIKDLITEFRRLRTQQSAAPRESGTSTPSD